MYGQYSLPIIFEMDREAKLLLAKSKLSKFQQKKSRANDVKAVEQDAEVQDSNREVVHESDLQPEIVQDIPQGIIDRKLIDDSPEHVNVDQLNANASAQNETAPHEHNQSQYDWQYDIQQYLDKISELEASCQYYSDMYR